MHWAVRLVPPKKGGVSMTMFEIIIVIFKSMGFIMALIALILKIVDISLNKKK